MIPEIKKFRTDVDKRLDVLIQTEGEKALIRAEAKKRLNDLAQEERTKDLRDLKGGNLQKEDLEKIAAKYPSLLQRVGSNGIKYGRDYGLPLIDGLVRVGTDLVYVAGRALLPLALLGSVLVGAETYKPGTINSMVKEIPEIAQTVRQVVQQLYQGTSGTQSAPKYITPSQLPSPTPKR